MLRALVRSVLGQRDRGTRKSRGFKRSKPAPTVRLSLECLEGRLVPAGTWIWVCPPTGDHLWSNPNGGNWAHNGNPAPAQQFPGMLNSPDDVVLFNDSTAGDSILNVALSNSLDALEITDWIRTTPVSLGTKMLVQKSASTGNSGRVTLDQMTRNLILSGESNYVEVGNGGTLALSQHMGAQGDANNIGGIEFGRGHGAGTPAVQVDGGGTLFRSDTPTPGVSDQVKIGGAVYNQGGTVEVQGAGKMLNITGKDTTNHSYWQKTSGTALLQIDSGSNINAAGDYQIDVGEVKLTAPSDGSADELDGAGLYFGSGLPTFLTIVDSTFGTPGTVTVQGPVTLAAQTTTTLNYKGSNNTADLLDVKNGILTVAGTLKLKSNGSGKPTVALNFLDDSGNGASIVGTFQSITGDIAPPVTYSGAIVYVNPVLYYYEVTIQ